MEIYIDTDRCKGVKQIWVFDAHNRSVHIKNGKLILTESSCTAAPVKRTPFLELPLCFADEFIQALVNVAHQKGIQTKEGDFKDGQIESMNEHLGDMRAITKKLLKME